MEIEMHNTERLGYIEDLADRLRALPESALNAVGELVAQLERAAEKTAALVEAPIETAPQKPALNDRVLITLQLPGLRGEQENVTMVALVTAVRADQPMLASLTVFPPMDSGLPPAGQLWAPFNASGNRKVGEWFWPT